jgi:polysaccharide pyruvyl transferase WcaK-like protein
MPKISILGGDSDHNLGDLAILVALCQSIARASSDSRMTVFANNPSVLKFLPPQTRALSRGASGFARLLGIASKQDLIVVGGGGLFQDDDSRIKMPYWAARVAMLRALNQNVVGHAVGAGPLDHAESRQCARFLCTAMRSVSVRDLFAQSWIKRCTDREVPVVPDPAFMLNPASDEAARAYVRSIGLNPDRPIIGVALRRWFHRLGGFVPHRVRSSLGMDKGSGQEEMSALANNMADALRSVARRLDAQVMLMQSYNVAHEADSRECERLQQHMADVETRLAIISDPALYKAVAGQTQLMISARMHPLILASSMGVPVVGLAYNGKFEGLFGLLGLKREVLWLNRFKEGAANASDLEQLAADALNDKTDLRHRAEQLGAVVDRSTRELVEQALAA